MNQIQQQAMMYQADIRSLIRENQNLKEQIAMQKSLDSIMEVTLAAYLQRNLLLSESEIREMLSTVDKIVKVIGGMAGESGQGNNSKAESVDSSGVQSQSGEADQQKISLVTP